MQEDVTRPILPQNRFPHCLFMKLKSTQLRSGRCGILLTINFNEQKLPLGFGRVVWFGLRSGDLQLQIENGAIPYESRRFRSPMDISIATWRTVETCDTQKHGKEQSASGSFGFAGPKGNASVKGFRKKTRSQEGKDRIKDEFEYRKWQIRTKGPEEKPVWTFECVTGERILRGSLVDEKLGTLHVSAKPCCVDATFICNRKDKIYITY